MRCIGERARDHQAKRDMAILRKNLKRQGFKQITTGRRLRAIHPGEVLRHEFIDPMGLTRYRVAKAIGVNQRRVDEICDGKRGITADTAVRLGLAFGIDAQFWLNLQTQYDLEVVARDSGATLAQTVVSLHDAA